MESCLPIKENLIKKIFTGFGNQISTLINLNINGSPIEDLDAPNFQSIYESPSLGTPYDMYANENKINQEDYQQTKGKVNDCSSMMIEGNKRDDIKQESQRQNSIIKITDYIKEKNKDPEIPSSHCTSLNSAFRHLNTSNRYPNSNNDHSQRRKAIINNSHIEKPIPVFTMKKRERDYDNEDNVNQTKIIKKKKLNDNNEESILQYNDNVNDDISMRSYKSYLSNRKDKDTIPNQSMNAKKMSFSSISLKSLDEIKKEIDNKRKETERKVDEFQRKNISIQNTKDAYEDKKKILIDYYNEKAKALRDATIMYEKEKLKKDSNFNNLKLSKNDTMSFKGKEKIKPTEIIMKQNDLFFEKSVKKDEDNQSMNVKKIESLLFSKSPEKTAFVKKEEPLNLTRTISFSQNDLLFGGKNTDSFFVPQKTAEPIKEGILFNNINKVEEEKNKLIEKKKGTYIFGDKPETKADITPPSIFSTIDKTKDESLGNPANPITPTVETKTSTPSLASNIPSTPTFPAKNSLFGGASVFGTNLFTNKKTEENKQPRQSLFDNLPKSNSSLFQPPSSIPLTEAPKTSNSIFASNTTDTTKPVPNTASLFSTQPTTSPQDNTTSLFKANVKQEEISQTPAISNPPQGFISPKNNSIDTDEKVKELITKNQSSAGSLVTPTNPFLQTVGQPSSINQIFTSPTKPIDNNIKNPIMGSNTLFSDSSKQNTFIPNNNNINNQSNSLFNPKNNSTITLGQNQNQNGSSLFAPNNFTNPVTASDVFNSNNNTGNFSSLFKK